MQLFGEFTRPGLAGMRAPAAPVDRPGQAPGTVSYPGLVLFQ